MSLKRILMLAVAAAMVGGLSASPALADEQAHGEQHVYVIVESNITIGGLSPEYGGGANNGGYPNDEIPQVDLGRVQTGMFCGWIRWRVDANTEAIRFCFAASDLYKGDDPFNSAVPPIPLYMDYGVEFDAEYGNPALGQSAVRPFRGQTTIGDFPAYQTDYITIESSQNGHFSQYLTTHVCWYQDDPEKPTGQYSGAVGLWGFVVPNL
jgi:hypothetical protein